MENELRTDGEQEEEQRTSQGGVSQEQAKNESSVDQESIERQLRVCIVKCCLLFQILNQSSKDETSTLDSPESLRPRWSLCCLQLQ